MAQAPLPDLENDPRVTSDDYRPARQNAALMLEEIVGTYVKIRFPPSVGTLLRNHYATLPRKFNLSGQKIAVVLQDYGDKLRAEPDYPRIRDLFLRNINVSGPLTEKDENSFKNLIMACFLPTNCDFTPPHDDWIMMGIAMATEVIIEVLLSTASIAITEKVMNWLLDVYKPRRNFAFSVSSWLFHRWLKNYKVLRDPQRVCCLFYDSKVLTLSQADLLNLMGASMPPTEPGNRDTYSVSAQRRKTILCPDFVPANIYGSNANVVRRQRPVVAVPFVNDELLRSYTVNRVPTQESRDKLVKELAHKDYTDFSQKPIGRTMTMYGDAIAKTAAYKELLKNIREETKLKLEKLEVTLVQSIFPANATITSDLIMTVFLLTSDIINEFLAEGKASQAHQVLIITLCSLKRSKDMSKSIQEILLELPNSHSKVKDSTDFDIPKYKATQQYESDLRYNVAEIVSPQSAGRTMTQAQNKVAIQLSAPQNVAVNMGLQIQRGRSSTRSRSAGRRPSAQGDSLPQALQSARNEVGFSATKTASGSDKQKLTTQSQMQKTATVPTQQRNRLVAATVIGPPSTAIAGTQQTVDVRVSAPQNTEVNVGLRIQGGRSIVRSRSAGQMPLAQDDILSQAVRNVFGEIGIGAVESDTNTGDRMPATQQQMTKAPEAQAKTTRRPAPATITGPLAQDDILSQAVRNVFGEVGIGAVESDTNSGDRMPATQQQTTKAPGDQAQTTKRPAPATITGPTAPQSKTTKQTEEGVRLDSIQPAVTVISDASNQPPASTQFAQTTQTIQINLNTQEELDLLDALEGEDHSKVEEQVQTDVTRQFQLQEAPRTTAAESQEIQITINTQEEVDMSNTTEDLDGTDFPLLSQQELDEVTSGPITDEFLGYYDQLFGDAQQE